MAITRITQFECRAGEEETMHTFLLNLIPYIEASPGCLGCEALRAQAEPRQFVMLERWINADAHATSVANYPPEQMQSGMALLASPPKGGFFV